MIEFLSNYITDFFYSNNIIKENEKEIISYGLQLIISSVIGISLILSFGIILNRIEKGIYIIEPSYDSVGPYDGMVAMKVDSDFLWGIVNPDGEYIIDCKYNTAYSLE